MNHYFYLFPNSWCLLGIKGKNAEPEEEKLQFTGFKNSTIENIGLWKKTQISLVNLLPLVLN